MGFTQRWGPDLKKDAVFDRMLVKVSGVKLKG